jgi:hypothetical protein
LFIPLSRLGSCSHDEQNSLGVGSLEDSSKDIHRLQEGYIVTDTWRDEGTLDGGKFPATRPGDGVGKTYPLWRQRRILVVAKGQLKITKLYIEEADGISDEGGAENSSAGVKRATRYATR